MESKARLLTGLNNPNSPTQLREYLAAEQGLDLPDLTKATVAKALADESITDTARAVLEIRQEMGKTSVKKFDSLARATSADDRLRHCLQFYGASRTGRWAGRTFQPQNIPRGSVKSPEQLRDLVETVRAGHPRGYGQTNQLHPLSSARPRRAAAAGRGLGEHREPHPWLDQQQQADASHLRYRP